MYNYYKTCFLTVVIQMYESYETEFSISSLVLGKNALLSQTYRYLCIMWIHIIHSSVWFTKMFPSRLYQNNKPCIRWKQNKLKSLIFKIGKHNKDCSKIYKAGLEIIIFYQAFTEHTVHYRLISNVPLLIQ